CFCLFFFSSRRRHTRFSRDWSSDVCSSDLPVPSNGRIGMTDLQNWTPRPQPERKVLEGRYVRLEPLNPGKHGDELFAASSVEDRSEERRVGKEGRSAWSADR